MNVSRYFKIVGFDEGYSKSKRIIIIGMITNIYDNYNDQKHIITNYNDKKDGDFNFLMMMTKMIIIIMI